MASNKIILSFDFTLINKAVQALNQALSDPSFIEKLEKAKQNYERQEQWRNDPLQIKKKYLDPLIGQFKLF